MAARGFIPAIFQQFSRKQICSVPSNSRYLIQRKLLHSNVKRTKASVAVPAENFTEYSKQQQTCWDESHAKLDPSFENAKEAFRSKTSWELFRALFVFNMCSVQYLVEKNKELMKMAQKALGAGLFRRLMKATFYGQFVAGEDIEGIKPLVGKNQRFGVKSILDYSVEKDISKEAAQKAEMESCVSEQRSKSDHRGGPYHERYRAHKEFGDRREQVTGARTYFYEDEAHCDDNMKTFMKSIDAVSGATNATGFAAIKLTALGRPQLLLQISEVLAQVRRYFDVLATETGDGQSIKKKDFERYLKSFQINREERKKWYTILDVTNDGEIDLLDWTNLLEVNMSLAKLLRVPNIETGTLQTVGAALSEEEEDQLKNMLRRVNKIVKYGKEKDVRIMIDAEQTYFQTAINRLTMEMMRKFNKDKAIVFNTYQCYLKEALDTITTDLALSKRENFYFGCKLVRGAYMEQERKRAGQIGYDDPINPSYEATTEMYQNVLLKVMQEIKDRPKGEIAVMIASHNEDTVRYTVDQMQQHGIHSQDKVLCFGQLLGMCDQISFSLGQAGYSVYKYVPYGPVDEVLPYLSRRALENRGVLDKVQKEKRMLRSELWRRLKKRQLFSPVKYPDVQKIV